MQLVQSRFSGNLTEVNLASTAGSICHKIRSAWQPNVRHLRDRTWWWMAKCSGSAIMIGFKNDEMTLRWLWMQLQMRNFIASGIGANVWQPNVHHLWDRTWWWMAECSGSAIMIGFENDEMTLDAIAEREILSHRGAIPDYTLVEDSGFVSILIIGE